MASDVNAVVGVWEGTGIDVAGIESALTRLWRQSAAREGAALTPLSARTSVLNFIVYVSREEDASDALATVGALVERHPSRTILVVADPAAPTSSLDASVTGQCGPLTPNGERLCWEQITITAHGATAIHAPSVVIPLLIPDLPVYLWWTGEPPFGTDLFTRMASLCDRTIVDSGRFADSIDGLARLAAINRATGDDRGVTDFHWIRLTPWRNLMAQFYDRAELRPYAERIERVRLRYALRDGASGDAQALLLAGWLASRLGWQPRPAASRWGDKGLHLLHLEAQHGEATVMIDIEGTPADGAAGADGGDLVGLTIEATLRDVPARFEIARSARDDEATTRVRIGATDSAAHTVRMPTHNMSALLCEELDVFRHDRVYEDALNAVVDLCERLIKGVDQ